MRYILVPFLLEYLAAEITVVFLDKYLSQASLYCSKTTACVMSDLLVEKKYPVKAEIFRFNTLCKCNAEMFFLIMTPGVFNLKYPSFYWVKIQK